MFVVRAGTLFVLPPDILHVLWVSCVCQSTASRRRLVRDYRKVQQDPPPGVNAAPVENNIMLWQAVIIGYVPPAAEPWA